MNFHLNVIATIDGEQRKSMFDRVNCDFEKVSFLFENVSAIHALLFESMEAERATLKSGDLGGAMKGQRQVRAINAPHEINHPSANGING